MIKRCDGKLQTREFDEIHIALRSEKVVRKRIPAERRDFKWREKYSINNEQGCEFDEYKKNHFSA